MIRIDIDDREVRQALERLQRKVGDLTPAMEDIGELLIETTKQRFATSTAPKIKWVSLTFTFARSLPYAPPLADNTESSAGDGRRRTA